METINQFKSELENIGFEEQSASTDELREYHINDEYRILFSEDALRSAVNQNSEDAVADALRALLNDVKSQISDDNSNGGAKQ